MAVEEEEEEDGFGEDGVVVGEEDDGVGQSTPFITPLKHSSSQSVIF